MSRWVVERTSTATQSQLHARIQIFKRQDINVDQLLDFDFKEKQCSTSWPCAPWWKAQQRSGLQWAGNFLGIGGGGLVWTRFSISKVGSSSTYFIGIRSIYNAFWAWFWGIYCWTACCRGRCWYCSGTESICILGSRSSKDKRSALINFWTIFFKAKQCSISWPGAPWWKNTSEVSLIPYWKSFWHWRRRLVCTKFFSSNSGSRSIYLMGIGSTSVLEAWFRVSSCWGACCLCSWMHNGWRCCWGACMHRGWGFRCTVNEDTRLVNFSTSTRRVVTSSRSSWTSCSSWSIFYVWASVCMCELKLKEDIRPLYWWIDLL